MKILSIISVLYLFLFNSNIRSQNYESFQSYISKFSEVPLPQRLSDASPIAWQSFNHITEDYISEDEIRKFLCINSNCKDNIRNYLYNYWFKINLASKSCILTLTSKDDVNEDDDNLEYGTYYWIFTTYNKTGKILSQIYVGKDRDNFLPNYSSVVRASQDTIYNKTIGPFSLDYEKEKDQVVSNVTEEYYIIDSNGLFKIINKISSKTKVSWNKKEQKVIY